MGGFVLIACGLSLTLTAVALGPGYWSERSERLAFLTLKPAGRSRTADNASSAGNKAKGRSWAAPLALYAGIMVALPGVLHGEPGVIGPLLSAALAGFVAPWAWERVVRHRRAAAMDRAAGDLVGHLRLQTSLGMTLLPALGSAPPVVREPLRAELTRLLADAQISPLPTALERFAERTGSAKVQALVRHLQHQNTLGIPLEQILIEEEQHYLTLAREGARQRIRSATMTLALVTFVLFMNGALIFATPLAIQAFQFLSE